jgi:hypothetical protein
MRFFAWRSLSVVQHIGCRDLYAPLPLLGVGYVPAPLCAQNTMLAKIMPLKRKFPLAPLFFYRLLWLFECSLGLVILKHTARIKTGLCASLIVLIVLIVLSISAVFQKCEKALYIKGFRLSQKNFML